MLFQTLKRIIGFIQTILIAFTEWLTSYKGMTVIYSIKIIDCVLH